MITKLDEALRKQDWSEIFTICFEPSNSPMKNSSWKDFPFSEITLNLSLLYGYYPLTVKLLESGVLPDEDTLLCALFSDSNNPGSYQFDGQHFNSISEYLLARGVDTRKSLQHLPFAYQPNSLLQKIDPLCHCSVPTAAASLRYAEAHLTFLQKYGSFSGLKRRVELNSSWQGKQKEVKDLKGKSVDSGASERKGKMKEASDNWNSFPVETDFFSEIEASSSMLTFFNPSSRRTAYKVLPDSDSEVGMEYEGYQDVDLSDMATSPDSEDVSPPAVVFANAIVIPNAIVPVVTNNVPLALGAYNLDADTDDLEGYISFSL
ncbi:hypothetical protein [Legionella shakespearei]|nr:hypothetical protein [Legionella shakespearei]